MNTTEYLKRILDEQTFSQEDQELKDLRQRRQDIAQLLRSHFAKSSPSIRWAGSMAKGTMIRDSYDGDMTCYFLRDDSEAGVTLEEIFKNTETALADKYHIETKASALRVRGKESGHTDFHVDVVPGRFTDDEQKDVFLHRTTPEKERLKTNLQVHIDHIKDSGVTEAIRLMKLWRERNGIQAAKTFILELLVVKLLKGKVAADLPTQLKTLWVEFKDNSENLSVEDPANSNNDLKPALDGCRSMLAVAATNTLWQVENVGWEAVYGNIQAVSQEEKKAAAYATVAHGATRTKPWVP